MTPLFNDAMRALEQKRFDQAITIFQQAFDNSPSAMDRMVIRFHIGLAVWEQAGLEPEGPVHSLVPATIPNAERAKGLWEDVVNIYKKEVQGNRDELVRWPFRGGSPDQMSKDAASAAFRAYSAVDRLKRGGSVPIG